MKECSNCLEKKPISEFQKDRTKKDGLRPDCKSCRKKYYNDNKHNIKKKTKEELTEYKKIYYEQNKQRILNEKKIYWLNNKDSIYKYVSINKNYINKRKNAYVKNRLSNDPLFKLKHNIRVLISSSLNGFSKKSKTNEILGCSFEYFKDFIESKFEDGMSWDNHGQSSIDKKWQLDHIIPISSGKTEKEILELNHYSNFQPLWEYDNKSKGNRITD